MSVSPPAARGIRILCGVTNNRGRGVANESPPRGPDPATVGFGRNNDHPVFAPLRQFMSNEPYLVGGVFHCSVQYANRAGRHPRACQHLAINGFLSVNPHAKIPQRLLFSRRGGPSYQPDFRRPPLFVQ